MSPRPPAFRLLGVPVYLPLSSLVGLAIVAWFAIPAASTVAGGSDFLTWVVALLHGLVVYLAVFGHEFGHVLVGRKLGYESTGVVVHIWGGHATFAGRFHRARDQFWVAVAGPLATGCFALVGWLGTAITQPVANSVFTWLAWSSALIAAINLLPGIPLDGGAALSALVWRLTGKRRAGELVAGLGGLGVAALWLGSPWLLTRFTGRDPDTVDIVLSLIVGTYLAMNAWGAVIGPKQRPAAIAEVVDSEIEQRTARDFSRLAVQVELGTTVAQALEQAMAQQAGAIVVIAYGTPVGIVRNAAIAAVPQDQREQVLVEHTARRVSEADRIPADTPVSQLSGLVEQAHAEEWLVTNEDGSLYGVIMRRDLVGEEPSL